MIAHVTHHTVNYRSQNLFCQDNIIILCFPVVLQNPCHLSLCFLVLMLSKVHSIVLSFHDWLHLAFMLAVFV